MNYTLTENLVNLIRTKSIQPEDLHKAALFTLDAIANYIGGRQTKVGRLLCDWGEKQCNSAHQGLLMGALTHILETDDLHRASVTHPGCVVVPAVFTLGKKKRSNGRDMLVAILHGYEAMCRIGNSVGQAHYKIWHNTATCGPFGSAMCTSTMLNLDKEQSVHALGNAGTQSSGLWQFLETGAMSKHLHAGRAVESGIIAAELAMIGFTGPTAILEGSKGFYAGLCPDPLPEAVLAKPAAPWQLLQTSIKPWPSCRHTHPSIDAALSLHKILKGRNIKSIKANVYQATLDICDQPNPKTEYEAKFSIYHCIAAAINDGAVVFGSFSEQSRNRLSDIRNKISVQVSEPFKSAYPDKYWGASISVTTMNGEVLTETRNVCKGDPEASLSESEMLSKAEMLLSYGGFTSSQTKALIHTIMDMPNNKSDWEILDSIV